VVLVDIAAALICFAGSCYPVLIGANTPVGEYQLERRSTTQYGYGGDVLLFKETEHDLYTIHRVINLVPEQRRALRLRSIAEDRKITLGCINLAPETYDALIECCSSSPLSIK